MATNMFDDAVSLYIRSGRESCNKFLGKFLNLKIRPFVMRVTGGCLVADEYQEGLNYLQSALTGGGEGSPDEPRFAGFCMVGGTQMFDKFDPTKTIRGITDVIPPLNHLCPGAQTLGIIAKVGDLKQSRNGLIVSPPASESDPYVTVVNQNLHSVLVLQPSADHFASWSDEARECIEIIDHLRSNHWQSLLVSYNGGSVVEEEIRAWATLGKMDPFWRVLLIKGSGRSTDKFASDEAFLEEHPSVHVCDNTEASIRAALLELGAVEYDGKLQLRG